MDPPMNIDPVALAKKLRTLLTKEEYLELQELLDVSDVEFYEAVSKEAAELAPELFVTPGLDTGVDLKED